MNVRFTKVNLIIINIHNEYYFNEIDQYKSYYVQSMYYKVDVFDENLKRELEAAIILSNGDSITTAIHSFGHIHFVEIHLLNRWGYDYIADKVYNEPNYAFTEKLVERLERYLVIADDNDLTSHFRIEENNLLDGYLLNIRKAECENLAQPVIKDLIERNIDYRVQRTSQTTFNAGASSFGEGVLIWIAKKFGDLAWDIVKKHLLIERSTKVEINGLEEIVKFLEENYNINRIHLILRDTDTLENGDKIFSYSTQYQDFTVTCDDKLKIKGIKTLDRTRTRI